MLKDSVVAEKHQSTSSIGMGSRLTVKVQGKEFNFEIVGSNEVDPAAGKISNESPLGQAFLGKGKGDKVEVTTPTTTVKYEILSVN